MKQQEYRQDHYIYDEEKRLKTCGRCGEVKDFSAFNIRKAKAGPPIQSYCRSCCTENAREYRKSRPTLYGRELTDVQWYIQAKEQPCTDCKKVYPHYCNDWDHLEDKTSCVAHLMRDKAPREEVEKEIASCELVCAVCHRKRTYKRMVEKRNLPSHISRRGDS